MLWQKRRFIRRITLLTLKISLAVCFVLFVILPLIYKNSYSLQRATVFLNFINVPSSADYAHPDSKYGLEGSRNFYLSTNYDDIKLGVWQILPENQIKNASLVHKKDDEFFENILQNGQDVVIYNHGNAGCRLTAHRVEIYKVLRKHFHVIAFDYRAYGDSTNGVLTEMGVIQDSKFIYEWVANRTTGDIFVWGHSLGTSIATQALYIVQQENVVKQPTGLILESPFNNMREEISEFPLGKVFNFLPWFEYTVVNPMQKNNFKFETDKYICDINVPIMILHAVDDNVVPYKLGSKLYEVARACPQKDDDAVIFYTFEDQKYGHKYLYKSSVIHEKIRDFIRLAKVERN